ncbi:Zinc finger, FYVE/PHD-type [Pseudocohnilembus persalinus]|uniref:Zinc finger, FYVE/PHD-type n=1 Tax=Pseudocohnilembus persalinus TaxID=266149 RepID=A0A0V0QQU5_PSEPJ|nr:Zinc finger, FYVE/PHD-type [Pseudocohnilembus persalinus]|eukprot:KRX04649.1 Zinc finger, FYVE/PHD-type [Pseudocohnilembus persalinus]
MEWLTQIWLNINNTINNNMECGKEYHMACLKCPSNNVEFIKNFECFNCILKKYDPLHKVKEEIIPPVTLKLSSSNQPNQFHFILNESQFKLLQDKSHNLEIRCIRVDIKHLYETTWPDFGEMKLNDQLLYDFKPLQMNSSLKKRKDEKYTIRDLQYLKMGENQLYIKEFTGNKEQKENFRIQEHIHIIAMYIVQKISCEKLTKEVKETSIKNEEECKQLIKKQFNESKDEVSIDKLSVSLNCNFDMQMMKTPAKGRWCKHLQCFSLENFIMITESTVPRKWKCPYCKQKCYDLLVDQYMLNIINECRAKQLQVSDVTFDEKANYKLEEEQFSDSEEQKQPTQAPKVENKDSKKESETQQNSSNTNTKNQNQQQNQVIILDSEDEDNNPVQQQNQYLNTNGIIPNGNEAMDLEERQQSLATVPTNVDMDEGPFQLLKLKEPEENKKIRNQFVTSIKESQFFYEDCDFEKFEEENYEESKHEFNSDKIVEISNHKITKNVKKQYPEIFSVLKKDQVIPIQNNPAYYQELQRANSFNYQNHFGDKPSQEDYAHFYSSPYPPLPPVFQGQKPFGYYSIQQFQTHPSLYPPQKYPQKKVQVQGASNEGSSNLATSNQTNNNNNNNNNVENNNNNNSSNNNVNNQKQNEAKNKIVEETNIPFGKKDDPICIDD